jgi:hypothetical protein
VRTAGDGDVKVSEAPIAATCETGVRPDEHDLYGSSAGRGDLTSSWLQDDVSFQRAPWTLDVRRPLGIIS